jgi:hypothetical protein
LQVSLRKKIIFIFKIYFKNLAYTKLGTQVLAMIMREKFSNENVEVFFFFMGYAILYFSFSEFAPFFMREIGKLF